MTSDLVVSGLIADIRACRVCRDQPRGSPLPHEPRPVLQMPGKARLMIVGQAPGMRVHLSGVPFCDPSGDRLRQWMGMDAATFYDPDRLNIVPMGFCFPGHDSKKGDLPPRRECRETWHDQLFAALPAVETLLAIGRHAQSYHYARLGRSFDKAAPIAETVRASIRDDGQRPRLIALPHPSWRNTGWLKANPWFEQDMLPVLRAEVARLVSGQALF